MATGFIIFHTETGAMDGVYFSVGLAGDVLAGLRKQYGGHWLLLRLVEGESPWVIPDHLFHFDEPMRHALARYQRPPR